MDKRTFLKSIFLGTAGIFAVGLNSRLKAARRVKKWDGIFRMPDLPYSFGEFKPFVDAETLQTHYNTIFANYTETFNESVYRSGLRGKTAHEILKNVSAYPASMRDVSGGYFNHKLFWRILTPLTDKRPSPQFTSAIEREFGSFENFKVVFGDAAQKVYSSGWAWLISDKQGRLRVTSTLNQDNPVMNIAEEQGFPLLCLDMCDHAYVRGYHQTCNNYVDSFWSFVNWEVVSNRFRNSKKLNN